MSASLDDLLTATPNARPSSLLTTIQNTSLVTRILMIIGIIMLVCSILLYLIYSKEEAKTEIIEIKKQEQKVTNDIYIDISGAVTNPGIYKLSGQPRINDAVTAAGGLLDSASTKWVQQSLNLAALLKDGQKLYIPFEGEELPTIHALEIGQNTQGLLNVNTATAQQLEVLPKIGPATAKKIVDYRQEHGLFQSLEEVMKVPGVGEGTFEAIRELITVQ